MPVIEGKYYGYAELHRMSGVPQSTLYDRCMRNRAPEKVTLEYVLRPVDTSKIMKVKDENGNDITLREAAKKLNVTYNAVRVAYHKQKPNSIEDIKNNIKTGKAKNSTKEPDWNSITKEDVIAAGYYSKGMNEEEHLKITCDLLGINRKHRKKLKEIYGDF